MPLRGAGEKNPGFLYMTIFAYKIILNLKFAYPPITTTNLVPFCVVKERVISTEFKMTYFWFYYFSGSLFLILSLCMSVTELTRAIKPCDWLFKFIYRERALCPNIPVPTAAHMPGGHSLVPTMVPTGNLADKWVWSCCVQRMVDLEPITAPCFQCCMYSFWQGQLTACSFCFMTSSHMPAPKVSTSYSPIVWVL